VALSSTALALKLFQESGHASGPGARLALGVALFQDVAVVLMLLLLPALFGRGDEPVAAALGGALWRGLLFCGGAVLVTRYLIPPLLRVVSQTRSRELFTLTVVGLCAGLAATAWAMGLSLALCAFFAGLVVSESVYSHRILADVLPFKDLFLALFFISVGLLIDLRVFLADWWLFLLAAAGIYAGKALLAFLAGRAVAYPVRACVQAGFALGSVGEFSLVLASKALAMGVISPAEQQFFLIITALTMAAAPLAIRFCGPVSRFLEGLPVFTHHVRADLGSNRMGIAAMENHAIICGYGPVGQRLNEALKRCDVPTVVVELNVDTVRQLKTAGQPVLFADAAQSETLPLAGLERAALLAVTFPHFEATRAIAAQARQLNPELPLFCRVKFDREVAGLERLGVECIVQDELECAVGLVHKALQLYDRGEDEILAEEALIRERGIVG
jgi:monovalent cation:H+ antiporter-2, CPA2 family